MKKVLAITLTMAMLFTMTAMAETTVKEMGDSSNPVTATYSGNNGGGTIYSVDITWGSLEYTYNAANKGAWDPETHTYKDTSEASWSCDDGADTITVTNHSNAGVSVSMKYEQSESYTNITGTLDNPSFELTTAENTDITKAPSDKSTLKLRGDLAENADNVQVGTVTVTIGGTNSNNGNIQEDISMQNVQVNKLYTDNTTISADNPLVIELEGNNLDTITDENFETEGVLILTINNGDNSSKNTLQVSSNDRITYSSISSNKAIITVSYDYFGSAFGATQTITNISYQGVSNENNISIDTSIEYTK